MSITVTQLQLASACPPPVGPSQNPLQSGCASGSTTAPVNVLTNSGLSYGVVGLNLNKLQVSLYYLAVFGGTGCFGVICDPTPGLLLSSSGAGLQVGIGAGSALIGGYVEVAAQTAVAMDASTNWVWLRQNGLVFVNQSATPPDATSIFLGIVTASGGNITAIDDAGVALLGPGLARRITGDIGPPLDSPPTITTIRTVTTTGIYDWNGYYHAPLPNSTNIKTISGALALTAFSSRVQLLTASGGTQNVTLPALTALPSGDVWYFWNQGTSNNVVVKSSTGTTLVTLTPGQAQQIPVITEAGVNSWPPSPPYTPGVPGPSVTPPPGI